MQVVARVCTCTSRMTGSLLLECLIIRPARLVQPALPFLNHRGRCFSVCSWRDSMNRLIFAQEQRVYFLILCNRDLILLLSAEWSEKEHYVSLCLYVYLFRFVITRAFSSRRLWTNEPFFCSRSVKLSTHSCVPLSFKATNEACATRCKILISSSALVQPVMFSVQNVIGIWTEKCHMQPIQRLSASKKSRNGNS